MTTIVVIAKEVSPKMNLIKYLHYANPNAFSTKNLLRDMSAPAIRCACAMSLLYPTILFVTVAFLLCGNGIIYNISIPKLFKNEGILSGSLFPCSTVQVREDLQSQRKNKDGDDKSEVSDALEVPLDVSGIARVDWFKKNLPEFRILQSNNKTRQFHNRLVEFLSHECEIQFFMTWISPARSFKGRGLLASESVFKSHPQGCLTILSRTMDSKRGYKILQPLIDCGFKVMAITPDLPTLFKNTPVEAWFDEMKRGKKDPGQIPLAQNLSNLMRLAVLYKYGGIYLDTDFIVLNSFKRLKNVIGAQSTDPESNRWSQLNNAVLVFDKKHPLLQKFMENFSSNFDGSRWGYNGPFLVSRVVAKEEARARPGFNFTIVPPMAFYPVDWNRIGKLFKKPENQKTAGMAKAMLAQLKRESYGIHLWNKHSKSYVIEKGSIIEKLVMDYCIICNLTTYSSSS